MKQTILILLVSSLTFSCIKTEQKSFVSKEELLKSISKSNEFKEFFKLSQIQSKMILSSAIMNQENIIDLSDSEIERLQLAKRKCIEKLSKVYTKDDLQSLNKNDLRIIVKSIALEEVAEMRNNNFNPSTQNFNAESCKKQYDRESNDCFEDFIIDEGVCFLKGLWGVVSGCHIDSVKDHLKCQRAADKNFRNCK